MAYTSHGHHIPGTIKGGDDRPANVARCGGVSLCKKCKTEVSKYIYRSGEFTMTVNPFESQIINEPTDYPYKAKMLVAQYVAKKLRERQESFSQTTEILPAYEIYVVWFCKVLGNWKALLNTTLPDGMYYEVTYNGAERETYIDAYAKTDNVVIKD